MKRVGDSLLRPYNTSGPLRLGPWNAGRPRHTVLYAPYFLSIVSVFLYIFNKLSYGFTLWGLLLFVYPA